MSEIKNVGGTSGPGGVDPNTVEDTPDTQRHSKFKEVARRLRQEETQQTQGTPTGTGSTSAPNVSDLKRELLRRAQTQGQQGQPSQQAGPDVSAQEEQQALAKLFQPMTSAFSPSTGNAGVSGVSEQQALANLFQSNPASSAYSSPTANPNSSAPSLSKLFGGGSQATAPVQAPNLQELFSGQMATPSVAPSAVNQNSAASQQAAIENFTPTFMNVSNVNVLTGTVTPLNQTYFASPETAQWLAQYILPSLGYPGATVIEKNAQASGGPFVAGSPELWIQLPNGTQINAGTLANYYVNNPPSQFPGLADNYVKQIITSEMQAQGKS